MINTAKEAEVSISPTIIIPVVANNGRYFRVRTLLDSGSGTNWISRKVLKRVKHTVKAKKNLQVSTFSGEVKQEFTLVEISIHDDQGKTRYIMCYVQDKYTAHMTAEGIVPHIHFNHTTPYSLSKPLADPNSLEVDHTDAAEQVGMILCSATTNTLRTHEPVTLLPELKILLEPTIFGTAISGAIPNCLKSFHQRPSAHNVAIKSVCDPHNSQVLFQDKTSQQTSTKIHNFCKYSTSTSFTSLRQVLLCCMILMLCLAAKPLFYLTQDCSRHHSMRQGLSYVTQEFSCHHSMRQGLFNVTQDLSCHHSMRHSANINTDPAYFLTDHNNIITFLEISPTTQNPPTKLRRPYERGKSVSLAQSRMSRVVLKHLERPMFKSYFKSNVSKIVLRHYERKVFNIHLQSNVSRIVLGHFRRHIIHSLPYLYPGKDKVLKFFE